MVSSKDMKPLGSPFFPNIFIRNQFLTKPTWPSKSTNLSSKVALVTGANQGLGLETSDQLLSFGLSRLIIAVRSLEKGEAAAKTLRVKYPKATIDVFELDMASYKSIRAFVSKLEGVDRLEIAILNAGVRNTSSKLVPSTGHEETIQVNYISTVLLCILLLPVLKHKSPTGPGRISIVGSGLAFAAKFANKDATPLIPSFDEKKNFDEQDTYNISKLLLLMFLWKLVEYVSAEDVVVNVVDPGFVKGTALSRDVSFIVGALMTGFKTVAARSTKVGASTYVDAAVVKGSESHGCYLMSWEIKPFVDMMYTPEGKTVTEKLWKETVAELSFANVQGVLDGFKKG